jgi:hypothetical protein
MAGDAQVSGEKKKPHIFKHDIGDIVQKLELDRDNLNSKDLWKKAYNIAQISKKAEEKKAAKKDKNPGERKKHEAACFSDLLNSVALEKMHLPAKDLTHLLCFESKESEVRFRDLLSSRTPVGNFIIEGSIDAARLFNNCIKRASPVFVMQVCSHNLQTVCLHYMNRLAEFSVRDKFLKL